MVEIMDPEVESKEEKVKPVAETPVSEKDVSDAKIEEQPKKKGLFGISSFKELKETLAGVKKEQSPEEKEKQEQIKAEKAKQEKIAKAKKDLKEMTTVYTYAAGSPLQSGGVLTETYANKWGLDEAGIKLAQEIDVLTKEVSKKYRTDEAKELLKQAQGKRNTFAQMIMDAASK